VIEHIKDIAEAIALVCAGGYFIYRTWTGYFRVNLSLSIECVRQAADSERDVLAITAVLKKGANGSLTLHDVQARVEFDGSERFVTFGGIGRSSYDSSKEPFLRKVLVWNRLSSTSPALKLVPGEETRLAATCLVPTNSVCVVEVAVLGQQTNRNPFGQWKASYVSLPRTV
jgi:hypothetical protein